MRNHLIALLLFSGTASAQVDLPVFGKPDVINGYAKDVEGEVLSYFSVYPEQSTTALLTRCTDGKKAIAWETAAVPFSEREAVPVLLLQLDRRAQQHHQRRGPIARPLHQRHEGAHLHDSPQHQAGLLVGGRSGQHQARVRVQQGRPPRRCARLRASTSATEVHHARPAAAAESCGPRPGQPDWFMTFRYTFEEKVEVEVAVPKQARQTKNPSLANDQRCRGRHVHGEGSWADDSIPRSLRSIDCLHLSCRARY